LNLALDDLNSVELLFGPRRLLLGQERTVRVASLSTDSAGRRRIQFDDTRKSIRLGKCDRRTAEAITRHVEGLLSAKISGETIPRDTAAWLSGIGPKLRKKLAAVGLVQPEQRVTVGEFTRKWLDEKKAAGYKPASLIAWGQTVTALESSFGKMPLTSLGHADGETYRSAMQTSGLRATTVHRRLGHARQLLEDAVRRGLIPVNPWKHVRQRAGDPSERRAYVSVGDVQHVIDHCPNVWWKLLVALARFGGLRVPSEAFSLVWRDLDWDRGRLTVPSPKTENSGKSHRIIPLFPLLRPHLETAFDHAEEGSEFIFPINYRQRAHGERGWGGVNLRTTLGKVIRRAGVEPWPRVWHSLRASCESDLAQSFPLAVVTKWLGNTPSVALRHYVDPTEAAFDLGRTWTPAGVAKSGAESGAPEAQNRAQRAQADARTRSQMLSENAGNAGVFAGESERSRAATKRRKRVKRECMGIEPTESFVQTLHRF
jgi:integrase